MGPRDPHTGLTMGRVEAGRPYSLQDAQRLLVLMLASLRESVVTAVKE